MSLQVIGRVSGCNFCDQPAAVIWHGDKWCAKHALDVVGTKPAISSRRSA
jgi:hypothetical protein